MPPSLHRAAAHTTPVQLYSSTALERLPRWHPKDLPNKPLRRWRSLPQSIGNTGLSFFGEHRKAAYFAKRKLVCILGRNASCFRWRLPAFRVGFQPLRELFRRQDPDAGSVLSSVVAALECGAKGRCVVGEKGRLQYILAVLQFQIVVVDKTAAAGQAVDVFIDQYAGAELRPGPVRKIIADGSAERLHEKTRPIFFIPPGQHHRQGDGLREPIFILFVKTHQRFSFVFLAMPVWAIILIFLPHVGISFDMPSGRTSPSWHNQ